SEEATANLLKTFRTHCTKCHGDHGEAEGEVNLLNLKTDDDLQRRPELLESLITVLRDRRMPPADSPSVSDAERQQTIATLQMILKQALMTQPFVPIPIRRMNRFQYNNAVQDLFALKLDVFALPERMLREHGDYFQPQTGKMPDQLKAGSRPLGKSQLIDKRLEGVAPFPQDLRAEHGFDNRGDHLTLSPLLMESFLNLSRSIVQSEDFNEKTCGIWNEFFVGPGWAETTEHGIRSRLERFLTLAFRKPVEATIIDRYSQYALARIQEGLSFTDSMKEVASAVLASPRFLYLYDRAETEVGSSRVDGFELASRLSFFLWGSIPDEELLTLAANGSLSEKEVLSAQVDRMLKDHKLKRFCDSFPAQWLQLERIVSSVPDPDKYPDFYFAKFRASMHMMMEPLLLFETILVENRSILELIDSNFSYRSDLLDTWYIDGSKPENIKPTAVPFKRVPLLDRREGGVITNAAILTMTSSPIRTKPITRGAWIASVIFNDPPEPPPADVPPLEETAEKPDFANLPLREQFAIHREREDCAGCHKRIDPLGFALENYGPTGVWRDTYENGNRIDASGELFKKHPFTTIEEFKDAILAEKDRFTQAFATHLLSFALGRETGVADTTSISRIVAAVRADDYRIQSVLHQIVLSESFQQKSVSPH
ncbi:MAG: DUF1592 domain-containing protein, partial [Verrucomicrobiae bacterium]|nr:DUF1592 domain-containing protein [Verrucomicrobiae bacterium]